MKRPDMRSYFQARIDHNVHGMLARSTARMPADVARVRGDVTDAEIVVEMRDGTTWRWTGGRYSTRKAHGCYAPLMPKPLNA